VCPRGHLYCKGCIYEHLVQQKQHNKVQLAKYEEQQANIRSTAQKAGDEEQKKFMEAATKFVQMETGGLALGDLSAAVRRSDLDAEAQAKYAAPAGYEAYQTATGRVFLVDKDTVKAHSVSTKLLSKEEVAQRKKILPCFWVPALTPDAGETKVAKPTGNTVCPEGRHHIRLKQLVPVRFTSTVQAIPDSPSSSSSSSSDSHARSAQEAKHIATGTGRFMCPSCRRGLTNTAKLFVLAGCGHVLCATCSNTFCRKDKTCVECGRMILNVDTEIIPLQSGGTGFSAHGAKDVKARVAPAFVC